MNYPPAVSVILVPMIIALFAITVPLLLQTIGSIDNKYNSTRLVRVFFRNRRARMFIFALILSLISLCIWIFSQPRTVDCGFLNPFVDHSAFIFLEMSTLFLVISFLCFVYQIYVFYIPNKLLTYLIKKHHKYSQKEEKKKPAKKDTEKSTILVLSSDQPSVIKRIQIWAKNIYANQRSKSSEYFLAISEMLYFAIKNNNEELTRDLLDFYAKFITRYVSDKVGQIIVYPDILYNTLFEANELLCRRDKRFISSLNSATFYQFLIEVSHQNIISEKTYSAIWKFIDRALLYDHEEAMVSYWGAAHQYFNFYMEPILPIYKSGGSSEITNSEEIKAREEQRERFLEFHYALGALVLYMKKYDLLGELMFYTNQSPPKYLLVPEFLSDVIERYVEDQESCCQPFKYQKRYNFPENYGINADYRIRVWIRKYMAVLFLRQYTLDTYYINSDPLEIPHVPDSILKMDYWKKQLEGLKDDVNTYLENKNILKKLGLPEFSSEWFTKQGKRPPSELIDSFIVELNSKYDATKIEQTVSKTKKQQFLDATKDLITTAIAKYKDVNNKQEISTPYESFYLNGGSLIMEKACFADNQEFGSGNSHSIFAEMIARDLGEIVANEFSYRIPSKSYLVRDDEIFDSIRRLNLKPEGDYILISIGLYSSHITERDAEGRVTIDDIRVHQLNSNLGKRSLLLLKKEDLPSFITSDILKAEKDRYGLTDEDKIDDTNKLYAALIDLNQNEELRNKLAENSTEKDLTQSVLVYIGFCIEMRRKKNLKCIRFDIFDQFNDVGNPNNAQDVKSLWDEEGK